MCMLQFDANMGERKNKYKGHLLSVPSEEL